MGRATLLATIQPNALVHAYVVATRYHYLAQSMLAVVLCLVVAEMARRLSFSSRTTGLLLAALVTWAIATNVLLRPSVAHFDELREVVARQHDAIRSAALAQQSGSTICLPNETVPLSVGFPGSVGIFLFFNRKDEIEGRRVYFVSSDPVVLALRQLGGRLGSLLLPAGSCPPGTG
jgi:hypothetical protein